MAAPRILFAAARNFRRALPLLRDARVPLHLKLGTALLALLIISPLDVFGDIPVLGLLDDAVLLTLLCWVFVTVAQRLLEKDVTPRGTRTLSGLPRVL
ncbi:MAG TPA: hypothetical protein VFE17_04685 [Candidatus Baltobacteraceae bacterium]|jgi:uncharacterized membrane protein YkvA (DUF1232 family)|nr:hypothetical protein [Candidatus Baltobacteraceae bacterium]